MMKTLPKPPKKGDPRRIDMLPLRLLLPTIRNPKDHDLEGIIASLIRFGYGDVIGIDERTKRLISGHGRTEALAKMEAEGIDPPEGVHVIDGEWCVPVTRGWRSSNDDEAEGYLVAANKLGENGGWDRDLLAEMLEAMDPTIRLAAGVTDDELADMLDRFGNENPHDYRPPREGEAPEDFPEFGEGMAVDFSCPRCGHGWRGNPKPLAGGHLSGGEDVPGDAGELSEKVGVTIPNYDEVFPRVPDAD